MKEEICKRLDYIDEKLDDINENVNNVPLNIARKTLYMMGVCISFFYVFGMAYAIGKGSGRIEAGEKNLKEKNDLQQEDSS